MRVCVDEQQLVRECGRDKMFHIFLPLRSQAVYTRHGLKLHLATSAKYIARTRVVVEFNGNNERAPSEEKKTELAYASD